MDSAANPQVRGEHNSDGDVHREDLQEDVKLAADDDTAGGAGGFEGEEGHKTVVGNQYSISLTC